MPAGSTYTPIATTTLGSAQATVTFSSIASTYTDLVLICSPRGATGGGTDFGVYMRFNGDSSSGLYSDTLLFGTGSSASSNRRTGQNQILLQGVGNLSNTDPQANVYNIMNYSNTTTFKTVIGRSNNPGNSTEAPVGLWRNTNAISSVTVFAMTGAYATGSTFTLYGIASA